VAALDQAGGRNAAEAIRTTDTVAKQAVFAHPGGWTVGGMAKGAAMLAPSLATMLSVLTTDASVDKSTVDSALRTAVARTFERVDGDGCMSTNDTVVLMASGASGATPDASEFTAAVEQVCHNLAQQLVADAEGATKDVMIEVGGAANEDDAVEVGRAIARNNLLKCALFGNEPQLGTGPRRDRHDERRLRPRRAGRDHQRHRGLSQGRGRRPARPRRPVQPSCAHRCRAARRRARRHDLDQRPIPRLRRRELGVLVMNALEKAAILVDALPWLERFHGKVVVIKYGGNAMISPELQKAFAEDIVFLRYAGLKPVVVHGGGPQITEHLAVWASRPNSGAACASRLPNRWPSSGWCSSAK